MSDRFRVMLLFGGPGVGKGSQGKVLGAVPCFFHSATGDIFRALDRNSELGKVFYEYSSRGELVPDDITVKIWHQWVRDMIAASKYDPNTDLMLLDGIPRTIQQAGIIDDLIEVLTVLHIACDDSEVMFARLRRRALKEGRHDDADETVIQNRWDVYERTTAPVLKHYDRAQIAQVNAIGTPLQVLRRILEVIEPIHTRHFVAYAG